MPFDRIVGKRVFKRFRIRSTHGPPSYPLGLGVAKRCYIRELWYGAGLWRWLRAWLRRWIRTWLRSLGLRLLEGDVLLVLLQLAFLVRRALPLARFPFHSQSRKLATLLLQAGRLTCLLSRPTFDEHLVSSLPNLAFAAASLFLQFHDLDRVKLAGWLAALGEWPAG